MPYLDKAAKLANAKRYREANKNEVQARIQAWRVELKKDPEKYSQYIKDRNLLTNYGINSKEVSRLIEEQDNACALCKGPFGTGSRKDPVVDHDHESGQVRGILHRGCNMALGQFGDGVEGLIQALEYLNPSPEQIEEHW